jgi:hypothetical protein
MADWLAAARPDLRFPQHSETPDIYIEQAGVMPPITRSLLISSTITLPGSTRSGQ